MNMILRKIILDNFKGVVHGEYSFGMFSRISGKNGAGKTTIADAWMWLFHDKDYSLASNPNIRPNDGRECIPTVTAILDVDGVEIMASKMQKMRSSKPDEKGQVKVTITNAYEINAVPKNQKDFIAYFTEHGVDLDKMLFLTNPDVFMGQKTADMRKLLFSMASTKTDQEIASNFAREKAIAEYESLSESEADKTTVDDLEEKYMLQSETADVAKMLSSYKMDEIKAMETASKKKAQENLDAIPNQIIGKETSKVEVNVKELTEQKKSLNAELENLEKKASDKSGMVDELQDKAMRLQFDKNALYSAENDKVITARREMSSNYDHAVSEKEQAERSIASLSRTIELNKSNLKSQQELLSEMGKKFHANEESTFETPENLVFNDSEWVFDDSTTVCSLCGQKLPASKIEALKANFEDRKKAAKEKSESEIKKLREHFLGNKKMLKDQLITDGNDLKKRIEEIAAEIKEDEKSLVSEQKKLDDLKAKIEQLTHDLASVPDKPDMTKNEEYQKYVSELESIDKQITELRSKEVDTEDIKNQKQSIQQQIDLINMQLAQEDANKRIDQQIEELKASIVNYEQAKADAEKILYQLDLVGKKKNELLTEEINKHFKIVKWKLFDYMKNGNYEECCIPMIDGRVYGVSTNTGREIQARLDIVYGLQRFYDQAVPVFIDGAEAINSSNIALNDGTQLITLNVTENQELTIDLREDEKERDSIAAEM